MKNNIEKNQIIWEYNLKNGGKHHQKLNKDKKPIENNVLWRKDEKELWKESKKNLKLLNKN